MAKEYGYWIAADEFLKDRNIDPDEAVHEIAHEQLRALIALAMARGHYGDKVAYICDGNGTAWDKNGRHFDGAGQGSDFERY